MKNKVFAFLVLGLCAVLFLFWAVGYASGKKRKAAVAVAESRIVTKNTWLGYIKYFIGEDGRVSRPLEKDTVSEGQAYAMLRAAWMRDKIVFDKCYRWTEEHLSRRKEKKDDLLAWRWQSGQVIDWMPASDAMVDYALSLIFADALWPMASPDGLEDYGKKARGVLRDTLDYMTYRTGSGRLYLSPWILSPAKGASLFPVNPSYYSPAHFKIFFDYTKDKRWLELKETAYFILENLSRSFNGAVGVGLIPDWCAVDENDHFVSLEGKAADFGWEAVRIPFRVALDYYWFAEPRAKEFLSGRLSDFIASQWRSRRSVFCEYRYDGKPVKEYESPLFYAAYACMLEPADHSLPGILLDKTREFIVKQAGAWVYNDQNDYYANSLAWFADGLRCGIIRHIKGKENR